MEHHNGVGGARQVHPWQQLHGELVQQHHLHVQVCERFEFEHLRRHPEPARMQVRGEAKRYEE